MPDVAGCRQFADYVVDDVVAPDLMPVTTNGAESCHGHLNADFNAPHPKAPFTRYNLLSNPLSNRLYNRFDNGLYRVNGV